jgi:hydroxymethylglutaryl-CoA reductase (NADPH)
MLVYPDVTAALRARDVVAGLVPELEALTSSITRHGRLVEVRPEPVGRRLVLRLVFTTGDAIGINMAAHAAELCSVRVAERTGASERYVHGEDVEKRANARALHEGRGRSVVSEVRVPAALLAEQLRVTPRQLVAIHRSYEVGFARLGTDNRLVQAANGLAALFLACGQDVAYVTESATGFLEFHETEEGDLLACAYLPSLLVGTVGGGSNQGTAAECLDLLGVRGDGGANVLAEIAAATVLAGDLSLMASFCTHEFVAAHERLGRNRPGEGV